MAASAPSPARTSVPAGTSAASSLALVGSAIATRLGLTSWACSANSLTDDRAPSAITSKRPSAARTTSSAWVPMDPVLPAMQTVLAGTGLESDDVERYGKKVGRWQDEQQRVEAVEQAAVTGQERAGVLDPQVTLDHGLDQVADRGDHRYDQAELEPVTGTSPGRQLVADDGTGDEGGDAASYHAFPGLARADGRGQQVRAELAADKPGHDIYSNGRDDGPQEKVRTVVGGQQQAGK